MNRVFKVTIEEVVQQEFAVEAEDLATALEIAKVKYKEGEFVLEPGELVSKRMKAGYYTDWREF